MNYAMALPFLSRYYKLRITPVIIIRQFQTSLNRFKKILTEFTDAELLTEDNVNVYRMPHQGHTVFVVQPNIKWGPRANRLTKPQFQLDEAVTLAKTLTNWDVAGTAILHMKNPGIKSVFTSGILGDLRIMLRKKTQCTALFIAVNHLTGLQHATIEQEFKLPVYDRYTIVLRIFAEHAKTREAKMQVALAEIPFLRSRIQMFHENAEREGGREMKYIGGTGETWIETRRRLLSEREAKLKKYLHKLKGRRNLLRQNRQKLQLPTVAVVGYTNAGKTALIKSITEDQRLEPKDQLFATLDVTAHAGLLPSFQKAIFMDTVGFVSDIPTDLVESFAATLEDIALADLIVHVRDLSHPETESQKLTVLNTLDDMKLPQKLMDTILEVGNKIDLVPGAAEAANPNQFLISAKSGLGVGDLKLEIEKRLIETTGLSLKTVRVANGGPEMRWLFKFAAVKSLTPDPEDVNYVISEIVFTPVALAKFKHQYGDLFI